MSKVWRPGYQRGQVRIIAIATLLIGAFAVGGTPVHAASTALTWGKFRVVDPPQGPLKDVSCVSPTFCEAVDASGNVLSYNGTAWSAPQVVDRGAAPFGFGSVSCGSTALCIAVEYNAVSILNGATWSAPAPLDPDVPGLVDVSCASQSFCMAISSDGDAIAYNGTSWLAPQSLDSTDLSAISCASASFCVAVDGDGKAYTYDAGTWSGGKTIATDLNAVSCTSPTFCAAVGNEVVTFNGASWTPTALSGDTASAVSCTSSAFCVASGTDGASTFNGTSWSAPVTLNTGYTDATFAVSCVTPTFCAAVGTNGRESTFNGTEYWTPPHYIDRTTGVPGSLSCATPQRCAAVDYAGNTLVLNHGTWTGPTSRAENDSFGQISCPSTTTCFTSSEAGADVYRLTGSKWTETTDGYYPLLSCATPSWCVGGTSNGDVRTFNGKHWSHRVKVDRSQTPLSLSCPTTKFCALTDAFSHVLTYDGSRWKSHKVNGVDGLATVSCTSSTFCAAADDRGHVVTYNGARWSAPRQVTGRPYFEYPDLSCRNSTFCVLASDHQVSTYDGKTWSSPKTIDPDAYLMSLSCPTTSFCAVIDNFGRVATTR